MIPLRRSHAVAPLFSLALASFAAAQSVVLRVSVATGGVEGNGDAVGCALSADGRFAAFASSATGLVAGDANGALDAFVHDRQTGVTSCVSVDPSGVPGNGWSGPPVASLSDDGRYVVFSSDASNLVVNDTNNVRDVFVRDTQAGVTSRASVSTGGLQANDECLLAAISATGRYVVFDSAGSNLVLFDVNHVDDVFVRDRQLDTTSLVSVGAGSTASNGNSYAGAISSSGRYVAFTSLATNLVALDTNGTADVFVRDRQAGTTTLVSVDSAGLQANNFSLAVSLTPDGRYVLFDTAATNIVNGDGNYGTDVYVHDRALGLTTFVSVAASGSFSDRASHGRRLTPDGRYAVFHSTSTDLIAGDGNGVGDVFVRDLVLGTTTRVSVTTTGAELNVESTGGFVSADGAWVGFSSAASNLVAGDTNGKWDAFVRELLPPCSALNYCSAGTTTNGCAATMSASGTPSATATSGFTLSANQVEGQRNGMIFYGVNGRVALPWSTTSTSFLCVKSPTQRAPVQSSGGTPGQCDGQLAFDWNAFVASSATLLGAPFTPGDVVDVQAWFRDPPAPKHSSTSDGLEFIVCP